MAYEINDITTWVVMSQEARGLDAKDWIVPPEDVETDGQAHWWLYKPAKVAGYRRWDDWSERLACALADLIGIPSAQVQLAQGVSDAGIISKNVTPNGWSLESGNTVLSETPGYESCEGKARPSNRRGHTLANISTVLDGCGGPPGSDCTSWSALEVFAGYLVFDAWIANTDRHAINWGVLTDTTRPTRRSIAASFDHGTALASGAQEEFLRHADVEHFATRGCATRFENGRHVSLADFALTAVDAVGGNASSWLERLARVSASDIEAVVAPSALSEVRRSFVSRLLEINQRRLTT